MLLFGADNEAKKNNSDQVNIKGTTEVAPHTGLPCAALKIR